MLGITFLKRHTNFPFSNSGIFESFFEKYIWDRETQTAKSKVSQKTFQLFFLCFMFCKLKPTERRLWLIDGFSVVMEWNLFWCGKLFSPCDLQQMKFLVFCFSSPRLTIVEREENIEKPHSTHFIVDFTSTKVAFVDDEKYLHSSSPSKRPPDCLLFFS